MDGMAVESDARPIASLTPGSPRRSGRELCAQAPRPAQEIGERFGSRCSELRHGAVPPDQYELDYLITPELGGAPTPATSGRSATASGCGTPA
jgi:hypothetical protein